ncbi:MAG: hypothetical protein IPK44_01105 [Candidatus Accumulibacter sp.]|uniref:hypothetical protein n=1 Tax=Accumulibacter sp. TaxID=2053492 RepID=UPI0025831417|nr:hypothetical protein [Accumulibacter sp.]MBK8113196.1 hypothetical protein [Accumulibacter sp.]
MSLSATCVTPGHRHPVSNTCRKNTPFASLLKKKRRRTFHHLDDYVWRSGDATLHRQLEYVKPQPLRKSKLVDKADPYYTPPQLWMPEHMEEAAVSFGQDDYEMSDDSSTPALELVDDSDWWETSKRTDRDEQYKPVRPKRCPTRSCRCSQAEGEL